LQFGLALRRVDVLDPVGRHGHLVPPQQQLPRRPGRPPLPVRRPGLAAGGGRLGGGAGQWGIGGIDPAPETWDIKRSAGPGAPDYAPFRYGATWYLSNSVGPYQADATFAYGGPGWTPVVGDWDGNGTWTVGVVDPTRTWYLRNNNGPGAPDIAPFAYGGPGWPPPGGGWDNDRRENTRGVGPPGTRYPPHHPPPRRPPPPP